MQGTTRRSACCASVAVLVLATLVHVSAQRTGAKCDEMKGPPSSRGCPTASCTAPRSGCSYVNRYHVTRRGLCCARPCFSVCKTQKPTGDAKPTPKPTSKGASASPNTALNKVQCKAKTTCTAACMGMARAQKSKQLAAACGRVTCVAGKNVCHLQAASRTKRPTQAPVKCRDVISCQIACGLKTNNNPVCRTARCNVSSSPGSCYLPKPRAAAKPPAKSKVTRDCKGNIGGKNVTDKCGACDDTSANDCKQDCGGVWGGSSARDKCGVCGGKDACLDCAGNRKGRGTKASVVDKCGTCDADRTNNCKQDCGGAWGGSSASDKCGVCKGDNSTCAKKTIESGFSLPSSAVNMTKGSARALPRPTPPHEPLTVCDSSRLLPPPARLPRTNRTRHR